VVLSGHGVRLEPLKVEHAAELFASTRDDLVWRFLGVRQPRNLDQMTRLLQAVAGDAGRVAWAVVVAGRTVGSTSYLDIDLAVEGLEIGWTWYGREVWGTHVNPACKLLLLEQAFDQLGAQRVTFKLDALNTRSFRAVERLGARYDGTLRYHRLRADGSVRDSAYFSILRAEWPAVRQGLLARLE